MGDFMRMSQVNEHLFICGFFALSQEAINQRGITCVVNATEDEPRQAWEGVEYVKVAVADIPSADISPFFHPVADKIKQVRDDGGKTLVHCIAGVSRSASLVCAYLMKHEGMSLQGALGFLKSKRSIVQPNVGFMAQLQALETALRR